MKKFTFITLLVILCCLSLSACSSKNDSSGSHKVTPGDGNTGPKEPVGGEPGKPTSLTAISGDLQVTLSWAAPSTLGTSSITGYEYQKRTTDGTFDDTWTEVPDGEGAREAIISGLTGATTYTFRLRAVNAQGHGMPEEISAVAYDGPTAEPGKPTSLAVYFWRTFEVTLSWRGSWSP